MAATLTQKTQGMLATLTQKLSPVVTINQGGMVATLTQCLEMMITLNQGGLVATLTQLDQKVQALTLIKGWNLVALLTHWELMLATLTQVQVLGMLSLTPQAAP